MHSSFIRANLLLAGLFLSPVAGGGGIDQPGQFTYGGQGTAIKASVLGVAIVLSDSGPLPRSGGNQEASSLKATVPGLLTADVLRAAAVGENEGTHSEASVTNFCITVEGNTIASNYLVARAAAVGGAGDPVISGGSEIVGLIINGETVVVSGEPNQSLALPNGHVVLNEQQGSVADNAGDITVNALHVVIKETADLLISSAHASIASDVSGSQKKGIP
ncbi:MAG: hypothetical protein A3F68_08855 [Acidobacteria bacterium RIFCSPLOWO2_12_FULL_54_10]|nr:MAG: hypothetical protein A3F68_08855 [Acidobacteria bacterium RIFCSPLOWO2_12_FULL_54_10]